MLPVGNHNYRNKRQRVKPVCNYWSATGSCPHKKCRFRHDDHDGQQIITLQQCAISQFGKIAAAAVGKAGCGFQGVLYSLYNIK